ncbi:hypothetical protein BS17DRAFT_788747 [Gyrodon lividus]|nr:hypothetical protein BS17DRAFT_788747 [Gyrodon lividus]
MTLAMSFERWPLTFAGHSLSLLFAIHPGPRQGACVFVLTTYRPMRHYDGLIHLGVLGSESRSVFHAHALSLRAQYCIIRILECGTPDPLGGIPNHGPARCGEVSRFELFADCFGILSSSTQFIVWPPWMCPDICPLLTQAYDNAIDVFPDQSDECYRNVRHLDGTIGLHDSFLYDAVYAN